MAKKVALLLFVVLLLAGTTAFAQGAVPNAPARQDVKMVPSITALEDTSTPETSLAPQATAAAAAPAAKSGSSLLLFVAAFAGLAVIFVACSMFVRKRRQPKR